LESRDKNVEGLRIEVLHQSGSYDDLWLAHGTLLEEAQKLHFEIIALNRVSVYRVLRHVLGLGIEASRILASDMEGRHVSLGHHPVVPRALGVGMRELGEDG